MARAEPSFEQVQIRPLRSPDPAKNRHQAPRVKNDFTPTQQAAVQLRVIGPEGDPSLVQTTADTEEGEYTSEYTPTREGSYRVEAEASLAGKTLGKDGASFPSPFPTARRRRQARPELLKQIAAASQGEYIPIKEWNEKTLDRIAAKLESHAPSQIIEQQQTQL